MRKFLVFLAVIAVAGYVYTHKSIWDKVTGSVQGALTAPTLTPTPVPAPPMGDRPYAFRLWGRVNPRSLTLRRAVVVVSGDRWRYESKDSDSAAVTVAVCDASHAVANAGARASAISLDPRSRMTKIFMASEQLQAGPPPSQGMQTCDGHNCWLGSANIDGMTTQLWIDSGTGMPVFLVGTGDGKFADQHFEQIPINFSDPSTAVYFDTKRLESIFTAYLNP